jgi:hypothetical protein
VGEQEKQAVHQTPLIINVLYASDEDFRVTGLNVLHAD